MTRYCVQVIRTYEIIADDEESAQDSALLWEADGLLPPTPICNVTDLDAIDEAVTKQQGRSAADCRAHNPEVAGSNPAPASNPQAPIAKVCVDENGGLLTMLYAPGLPPGEHDLYCEPEALGTYLRAVQPRDSHG